MLGSGPIIITHKVHRYNRKAEDKALYSLPLVFSDSALKQSLQTVFLHIYFINIIHTLVFLLLLLNSFILDFEVFPWVVLPLVIVFKPKSHLHTISFLHFVCYLIQAVILCTSPATCPFFVCAVYQIVILDCNCHIIFTGKLQYK